MSAAQESNPPVLREFQLLDELLGILREQNRPEEEIKNVSEAFEFARLAHDGQKRKNGENYIVHPTSVAIILAKIPVDTHTVMAALMHDVLEDTDATDEQMTARFGEDVTKLVTGVTKLGKFKFASKEDQQAENFRKMFLAMADDIRVILLKLADRLHNMQTLEFMKPEKQQKIAAETLEIFAPLANRMGMGKLRAELEDLALKYLNPSEFNEIEEEISHNSTEREETITQVKAKIQSQLEPLSVEAMIYGRVKNYYSIFKKMQTRQKTVHDIFDLSALRVIVNSEKECYEVLGVVHNAFTPIPGRFKDYIAMPKSNLYKSLHTTVIGPYGRPLEVQIRTWDMHRIAEYGIAAHWKYKETGTSEVARQSQEDEKLAWLRQMVEMKEDAGDAREYVDSVKLDLFRDEVFVFTPKGKVVVLPRGATPVDFAYRIHTEVGNTCTGAKVNGRIVPLQHTLQNGDILEVMTNKKSAPKLDWINFVQTHQAKARIRGYFKKHFREEHEEQGRRLLEADLSRAIVDEAVKSGKLLAIAEDLNCPTVDDLFVAIGYGEINLSRVTNRLKREELTQASHVAAQQATQQSSQPASELTDLSLLQTRKFNYAKPTSKSEIQGLEGMVYSIAKCCTPLPGEPIVGVVTRTRGVMVHHEDCDNLNHANPDRRMNVGWSEDTRLEGGQSIKLDVHVIDRVGVLRDILTKVTDTHTNLSNTKVKLLGDHTAVVQITVDVRNLQHLDQLKKAIQQVNDVLGIRRAQARTGGGAGKAPEADDE